MEPKKRIKKLDGFETEPTVIGFGRNNITYNQFEPTRQSRYIMEVPIGDEVVMFVVNCERPSHTSLRRYQTESDWGLRGEVVIPEVGRLQNNPIRVILRSHLGNDPISDVMDKLHEWYGNTSNKKNITIQQLDPTGVVIETWFLVGTFPSNVNMTTDYNHDDNTVSYDVDMDLVYDYFTIS